LLLAPLVFATRSVVNPDREIWSLLWRTTLPRQLITTVLLAVSVGVLTIVVGGGLAFIVTALEFPGRRFFQTLFVVPIALPSYVVAFVYAGMLSFPGPVQTWWRSVAGDDAWFPPIRTPISAAIVLTLTLYPYVYIPAVAAFSERSAVLGFAARSLGLGPVQTLLRVVLPGARPALVAGATLAVMETLTDIGVARTFGVQTVGDGVLRTWVGFDRREAATQLAMLLLLLAVMFMLTERTLRGRRGVAETSGASLVARRPMKGKRLVVVMIPVVTLTLLAVVLPLIQLVAWALTAIGADSEGAFDSTYAGLISTSLIIAGFTAIACTLIAMLTTVRVRLRSRADERIGRLSALGYALPGLVVAGGVLGVLSSLDGLADTLAARSERLYIPFLFTGSFFGVIFALTTRFSSVSKESISAGVTRLGPRMSLAASTLGARPRSVVGRIHLPLLRRSLLGGALLVALDALKELPATLLLRPAGRDTLSVFVWNMTNESRWEEASVPALTIVVVSVPLVLLLLRPQERRQERSN
jgi:iron(III) transport system permease protein